MSAVRQVQTTRLGGEETRAESLTRSRFSQRILEAGEVVLKVELSVEGVSVEIPSADVPPTEIEGYPRVGVLRMERNGRVLEMPPDMPVGRGLVFPDHPLEPGDSWRVAEDLQGGLAVVEHTFVGWEECSGLPCAHFSTWSLEYEGRAGGLALEGSLEGETYFDPEEGRVVRSLMSVTTRLSSGADEQLTQVSSQVDWVPMEVMVEASA